MMTILKIIGLFWGKVLFSGKHGSHETYVSPRLPTIHTQRQTETQKHVSKVETKRVTEGQ